MTTVVALLVFSCWLALHTRWLGRFLVRAWEEFSLLWRWPEPVCYLYVTDRWSREYRWIARGVLHRLDGPARVRIWECRDGKPYALREEWHTRGQRHREGGSAIQQWQVLDPTDDEYTLMEEKYYTHDQMYRTDGPAWNKWRWHDGRLIKRVESWHARYHVDEPTWLFCRCTKRVGRGHHRLDGPAFRTWAENGRPDQCSWYVCGYETTRERFDTHPEVIEHRRRRAERRDEIVTRLQATSIYFPGLEQLVLGYDD